MIYDVIKTIIDVINMAGGQMKKGLLDHLAEQTGSFYLSDLRYMERSRLCACLQEFPAEAYSLWEWTDAAQYFTGVERCFFSQGEAKDFLLHTLERMAN